jgi:hypothetical protein
MTSGTKLRMVCLCAFSNGIPRRSFYVAVVVGTILNLINQGDAIFELGPINWFKIILTYFVPYAVCTYGAVSAQVGTSEQRNTGVGAPWAR